MKAQMESLFPCWKRFEAEYQEVQLPSHDGVKLFTQIFTPSEDFKGPLLIMRSPYVTDAPPPPLHTGLIANLLLAGYGVISQHCRGCGKSEGICVPYNNERGDGLALLEWVRKQPFYDHEIYLAGGSYLASVHFSYLNAIGDDVKGAILEVQDCNRYNILYRNGFFKCGLHGKWAVGMYKKNQLKVKNFSEDTFRTFPLSNFSKGVFNEERTFLDDEFSHPDPDDPFWETPNGGGEYKTALDDLKIPVLFTTGFYDIYTEGVFDMWAKLAPEARAKCALVVTPYAHGYLGTGNQVITYENGGLEQMWPNFKVDWLNAIRENREPAFVTRGNITWHAQFEGVWRTAPHLENGGKELTFFLNDSSALDAVSGEEKPITYTYNPYDPATFKGGCCNNFDGQQLQAAPNSRYDVISFLTAPAAEEMVFQGRGKVLLKAATDCEDTCFYARLSIVNSKGECYCMRDDIVSVARQYPRYQKGETVELELNFAPNAFKLSQGEQLRLDISSSCWPYFLPHRNKKGDAVTLETAAIARNTIFTGSSKLILFAR